MRAVHLTAFGNPVECLEFVRIGEPPLPGPGEALIAVEFSPIDLSDLLVVRGNYPLRPNCRASLATRGVGRILAVGPGVENVTVGDRVLTPLYAFSWAERTAHRCRSAAARHADHQSADRCAAAE